jgi:hypothetical protein
MQPSNLEGRSVDTTEGQLFGLRTANTSRSPSVQTNSVALRADQTYPSVGNVEGNNVGKCVSATEPTVEGAREGSIIVGRIDVGDVGLSDGVGPRVGDDVGGSDGE